MGLRSMYASYAVGGAHVLIVESPGWWLTRVAVEEALVRRGWRMALSPADADVLAVCGAPGERLSAAIDRVWDQFPGPRARVAVTDPAAAAADVDQAAAQLLAIDHQRADAQTRGDGPPGGVEHGDMDHAATDHGDMSHDDMAPAGIALAEGGDDRDGLEMDVLRVPLGPVLPYWPAGLVLRCDLQGDVVTRAETEFLASAELPARSRVPGPDVAAARSCDRLGRLLAVAGWDDAAASAHRGRDALLAGTDRQDVARQVARLAARVRRSRSLRWLLRDIGTEGASTAAPSLDVYGRLLALLDQTEAEFDVHTHSTATGHGAARALLPGLVTGLDLAAVRLVVASLDLDPVRADPERADV